MATEKSFDGCSRVCRKSRQHTYTWGMCEHAPEPEPHLSVARHIVAGDGHPSIAMEGIPLSELADRIESALRSAPAGEYSAMALTAAQSLIGPRDAHSPTDARTPVSAATGEGGEATEAQEGSC
jgi:hypothetical protein